MDTGIYKRGANDSDDFYNACHGEDDEEQAQLLEEHSRFKAAFAGLSHKERFLIEKRNGIGGSAWSFEQLATAYEYSSTQSAERAYKKALKKPERELTAFESGQEKSA